MRRAILGLALLLFVLLIAGAQNVSSHLTPTAFQETPEKPPLPTPTPEDIPAPEAAPHMMQASPEEQAIRQAYMEKVSGPSASGGDSLGMLIFDPIIENVQISSDGTSALVWVGWTDPETGEVVATESSLSVARSLTGARPTSAAGWAVTLPSEEVWAAQLQNLPPDLLTEDVRMRYLAPAEPQAAAAAAPLTGYKLPWPAGLEKRVTNSIGHYIGGVGYASCPATCQYAYDFADGTMFPLLASKGGTVKAFKWTCANGDPNCTNYLVLEDQSTTPTTYQLYYHLAYNSVPAALRVIGAPVLQGQYIGNADDTGNSTGHHLHFHVYKTPSSSDWSWGASVDFIYDDVTDNGGRPRTCEEASKYPNLGAQCRKGNYYRSGNTPASPPTASLSAPADRQVITSRTVTVSGTANDDIQVKRIQVLVNYSGEWKSIGEITPGSGEFSQAVDLCPTGAEVPDGPFALTVRVYDYEGSQAGGLPVRQLIKNFPCTSSAPPPTSQCTPNDNQVALYADPDFLGACTRFDVNTETGYLAGQLGAVQENRASSIRVGANVRAVLYDWDTDIGSPVAIGRNETFEADDASLSDNRIGNDRVSGLRVLPRSTPPDEPLFNQPIGSSLVGQKPKSVDSLVLAWEGAAGATSFDVTLTGPGTNWTRQVTTNSLSVGNLAAGNYSLTVTARNSGGEKSATTTFEVVSATLPAASARSVPYFDDMESGVNGWTATGLWRLGTAKVTTSTTTTAWIYNDGTDYNSSTWRAGDLTSPPIAIPSSGVYYLRFRYFMATEDANPYWDQRRVQVSADGGPFTDLIALSDDKQAAQYWLYSGPISLADYAGKTIRLRFHFNTIDEENNSGKGWEIDDVRVDSTAPITTCADSNDSPAQASNIALNSTISAVICPEGDLDYYTFTGVAGQSLIIDLDARTLSPSSSLDSNLALLSDDGRSIIAENDDEEYGKKVDSLLNYTLSRDGRYYIKVKAWDHPGAGGPGYKYNLKFTVTGAPKAPKSVGINFPPNPNSIPDDPFELSVSAADFDGGEVEKVDFYWHGPDWTIPQWHKLGTDTTAADGWTVILDPLAYGKIEGSALYVQAHSRTGGVRGLVWWDLAIDRVPPTSSLKALPATVGSTAFQLTWETPDQDVASFDLQVQENGGAWQAAPGSPLGKSARSLWFVGRPGVRYGFRLRAKDLVGNEERFPEQAEATITVEASCTPDSREPDSTSAANSIALTRGVMSQTFNFCRTNQAGAGGNDVDWYSFQASEGEKLGLWHFSRGGGAGFKVSVYRDANTLLQTWQSPGLAQNLVVTWTAPATGTYYLKVEPLRADLFGTQVTYQLQYALVRTIFLPSISR